MRSRFLRIGQIAAVLALFGVVAFLSLLPRATVHADEVYIDSDEPRYVLGYEGYRLRRLGGGAFEITVYGTEGELGEIYLTTDCSSRMDFSITTDANNADVGIDLVNDSKSVVWIDGDPAVAVVGVDDDDPVAILLPFEVEPAVMTLVVLRDLLRDENFREEFDDCETEPTTNASPVLMFFLGLAIENLTDEILFGIDYTNCGDLPYQAWIDCCLKSPINPIGARGCLLGCSY